MLGPPGPAFSFPMNKFATVGFDIMTVTLPSTLTVQADVHSLTPMVTTGFIADMSFGGDIATADYGQGVVDLCKHLSYIVKSCLFCAVIQPVKRRIYMNNSQCLLA
jgi:hypothetical protein